MNVKCVKTYLLRQVMVPRSPTLPVYNTKPLIIITTALIVPFYIHFRANDALRGKINGHY